MYGAEYVRAIVTMPVASTPNGTAQLPLSALLPGMPTQQEVERDLAQYEHYVANRKHLPEAVGMQTGGDR
jgi:hypothetical protein